MTRRNFLSTCLIGGIAGIFGGTAKAVDWKTLGAKEKAPVNPPNEKIEAVIRKMAVKVRRPDIKKIDWVYDPCMDQYQAVVTYHRHFCTISREYLDTL